MLNYLKSILDEIKKKIYTPEQYQNYLRKRGMHIGRNCELFKDVKWGSEPYLITLGDHVRVTSGCRFITHDGGIWVLRKLYNKPDIDLVKGIKVGNNVHIGVNSIIMPGVTIGNNCIIGCGAVVTKDVPDNSIVGGIPARLIEDIDTYYTKNADKFQNTKHMTKREKRDFYSRISEAHNG